MRREIIALKGSLYFGRVNVSAGLSLIRNLLNFAISQIEISKYFRGCFQKKPESQKKEMTMATDMVVATADAIDGLKLYLEYIE